MDCMNLPKDVLDRLERRWAARVWQRTFQSKIQEVRPQRVAPEGLLPQKQPTTVANIK
jgi:hypothetical protein